MGIIARLGNVLKSYINDGIENLNRESPFRQSSAKHNTNTDYHSLDEDYKAAYEELEDFLQGEKKDTSSKKTKPNAKPVPPEIKADFRELGLEPHATKKECREAYKKLLKIHHPDCFAKDPEKMKKATEKTANINMVYERLEKWFKIS